MLIIIIISKLKKIKVPVLNKINTDFNSTIYINDKTVNLNRNLELECIYYLLKNYQFRISEIMNLSLVNLLHNYKIKVIISKTKDVQIIRDDFLFPLLHKIFSDNKSGTFSVNYYNVLRFIKKNYSNEIIRIKNKRRKITHSYRYREAQTLKDNKQDQKTIASSLRHHSFKSQEYYLDNKK